MTWSEVSTIFSELVMESLEQRIESLLRELLDRAQGQGFLSVRPEGEGTVVVLTPANPRAARMEVYVERDSPIVSVEIGRKVVIEVLESTTQPQIDAVRAIGEAVLTGDFEEEFWEKGSVTTKSIGRIKYGGRIHTYRWYGGVVTAGEAVRRISKYEPYVSADGV